ncbi:MAG: hypothetical protein M3022_16485 [Actinomycetota bacterium]|nr:hypothetical protein [Actinomycetota bacterium]
MHLLHYERVVARNEELMIGDLCCLRSGTCERERQQTMAPSFGEEGIDSRARGGVGHAERNAMEVTESAQPGAGQLHVGFLRSCISADLWMPEGNRDARGVEGGRFCAEGPQRPAAVKGARDVEGGAGNRLSFGLQEPPQDHLALLDQLA